nr:uncharacterized protein LOC129271545 [Lytechinus pictus]
MSRVILVISPRIIFVEESDNMTNLSGLYFLQGNAVLLAFAMLVWCCPTTQVTLHRDRRVVAVDDPLVDGVRSDGHSSSLLVSGVGTSVMSSSVVVDTHRQVYNRESVSGGTRSSGNDVPSGVHNSMHLDSTKFPSVRPSTREIIEKQWGGGSRESTGRGQSPSGHTRTGALHKSGAAAAAGSTGKGVRKGTQESSDLPPEADGGGGRGMDVIGAIPGEGNNEPSERIIDDSPIAGGGIDVDGAVKYDVPKQTTCEKCKKQQDEELLEQYDPNALMQLRIESIKRRILDKLRMERPPQVNMSSINVPAPLSEGAFIAGGEEEVRHHVHQVPTDAEEDYDTSEDYYGKTTRVIITAKAGEFIINFNHPNIDFNHLIRLSLSRAVNAVPLLSLAVFNTLPLKQFFTIIHVIICVELKIKTQIY